ncbi:MAG: HAD-IA family hydrolase [Pirellulaceae bacterium]|jgi:putative hydrolase of the HAD superfamily|nr:HAD-IA family hydrolase [Pirellulaceae bacterium]
MSRDRKLTAVRAVVFDAVGTLLFAQPRVADVYHLVGWQHGSLRSREEVRSRLYAAYAASEATSPTESPSLPASLVRNPTSEARERERWQQVVATVFDDIPEAVPIIFRDLWQHFAQAEHWRLAEGAAGVLDELSRRGYRLAIGSNFDRRLHAVVAGHPALRACERTFVSSEIGFPKPDERFFASAAALLGASPAEILMVGDDWTNDVLGARAAGWQALYLATEGGSPGTGKPDLSGLVDLLVRLPGVSS